MTEYEDLGRIPPAVRDALVWARAYEYAAEGLEAFDKTPSAEAREMQEGARRILAMWRCVKREYARVEIAESARV